eukprot:6185494-Pleurochrysis_carterae.AAC.3
MSGKGAHKCQGMQVKRNGGIVHVHVPNSSRSELKLVRPALPLGDRTKPVRYSQLSNIIITDNL